MVAFCALFSLAVACRSIHSIVLRFTPDDAYYYMRVAQNIGAGLGSRFDSLNTTNGYHPLWLAVISPVYFLVRDHLMALRLVLMLNGALWTLLLCRIYRNSYRLYALLPAACAAGIAIRELVMLGFWGMESALACVLAYEIVSYGERNRIISGSNCSLRSLWGFGGLLSLGILARLDSALMIPFLCAAVVAGSRGIGRDPLLKLVNIAAPGAVLLGGYVSINFWICGHAFPINGYLKSTFPSFARNPFMSLPKRIIALLAIALIYLLWYLICSRRLSGREIWLAIGSCFIITQVTSTVLFVRAYGLWSLAVPSLFAVLIVAHLVHVVVCAWARWGCRECAAIAATAGALMIAVALVGSAFRRNPKMECKEAVDMLEAAVFLKSEMSGSERAAISDAGIMSYFSQATVVNLDGLINSYAYLDYLKGGRFGNYLKDQGVGILGVFLPVTPIPATSLEFEYSPPVTKFSQHNGVTVRLENEVFRNDSVVVFRLRGQPH